MYSPEVKEEQIKRLYKVKEWFRSKGVRTTMAGLARDAIEDHLGTWEEEMEKGEKEVGIKT